MQIVSLGEFWNKVREGLSDPVKCECLDSRESDG